MKKYLVETTSAEIHYIGYVVEAESEDEANELVLSGEGDIEYDDYVNTEDLHINSVKEYDNCLIL